MVQRALLLGLGVWAISTIGIRLGGQYLLRPGWTIALYVVSFVAMALLVPRLCRAQGLARSEWPKAASLLILPTLILDAICCAFFPTVFPNLDPASAGLFGGWMLVCCGGGVVGAWAGR